MLHHDDETQSDTDGGSDEVEETKNSGSHPDHAEESEKEACEFC